MIFRIKYHWLPVLCLTFLLFLVLNQEVIGQQKVNWATLTDVTFEKEFNEEVLDYINKPSFGPKIQQLDGEEIYIRGYVIPVNPESDYYVLSANPFAACFFCGQAGPESVMEMKLKRGHRKFSTDEYLTFKGRFKLNSSDVNHLSYILEDADIY